MSDSCDLKPRLGGKSRAKIVHSRWRRKTKSKVDKFWEREDEEVHHDDIRQHVSECRAPRLGLQLA